MVIRMMPGNLKKNPDELSNLLHQGNTGKIFCDQKKFRLSRPGTFFLHDDIISSGRANRNIFNLIQLNLFIYKSDK
jgi:hypothetical protein